MAILGFELEEIARLIALVETQGLEELVIEEEGRRLRIRGPRRTKQSATAAVSETVTASRPVRKRSLAIAPPSVASATANLDDSHIALVSPMVGIFYRAEKPGAAPLVSVGDTVEVDQTVGVIEAMKVFSEFKADHAGTIVSIPADDGELVQAGAPLIVLKKR